MSTLSKGLRATVSLFFLQFQVASALEQNCVDDLAKQVRALQKNVREYVLPFNHPEATLRVGVMDGECLPLASGSSLSDIARCMNSIVQVYTLLDAETQKRAGIDTWYDLRNKYQELGRQGTCRWKQSPIGPVRKV